MTRFREKAEARTMQIVGEMIGDEKLVQEGKEQKQRVEEQEEQAATEELKRSRSRGPPRDKAGARRD